MIKYKKGQVGIARHPALYKKGKPLITSVEDELLLWKTAEKIKEVIKPFDHFKMMIIFHYIQCLRGLSDDEMYMLHAWMQMKSCESRAKQIMLEQLGSAAHQLAKKKVKKRTQKEQKF